MRKDRGDKSFLTRRQALTGTAATLGAKPASATRALSSRFSAGCMRYSSSRNTSRLDTPTPVAQATAITARNAGR